MLKNRLMLIVLGLLGLQGPLIAISQNSGQPVRTGHADDIGLSIHLNSNCDDRGLEWTRSMSVATGETVRICFTPKSSAYIYIINESAEGTYMTYPQSGDQLGPIAGPQSYAFDIVGEPGRETFTFFVTRDPIKHFDEAIRRSRLRLSRSRLLHGEGSEAFGVHVGTVSTDNTKHVQEADRRSAGSYWLVDLDDLESLTEYLLHESGIGTSRALREGVHLNLGISNLLHVAPQPHASGVSSLPKGTAMILEFSYNHRRQ